MVPLEPSAHLAEEFEKGFPVSIVDEYVLLPVAAGGQMIKCPDHRVRSHFHTIAVPASNFFTCG